MHEAEVELWKHRQTKKEKADLEAPVQSNPSKQEMEESLLPSSLPFSEK